MHYLLGLAALVIGVVIAMRRTRPTWFVVLTGVLVAIGAVLAILSYTRVTDSLGLTANSILGWTFVGLSLMTMLSAVFVLERRGEHGEELPPLIGDNPLDGDADDRDDPAAGQRRADYADSAAARAENRAAAGGSANLAGHAGAAAATAAAFGDGIIPSANEMTSAAPAGGAAMPAASDPGSGARSAYERTEDGVEDPSRGAAAKDAPDAQHDSGAHVGPDATGSGAHAGSDTTSSGAHAGSDATDSDAPRPGDAHPGFTAAPEDGHKSREDDDGGNHPGPSDDAVDGTAVVGADPDIFTPPSETDVDAAPEGRADTDRDERTDRT